MNANDGLGNWRASCAKLCQPQVIFVGVVGPCWCPLEGDPIDPIAHLVTLQNLSAGGVRASLSQNPEVTWS